MLKYISLCIIMFNLVLISAGQVTTDWKEHKVSDIGFTIKYPPTWTLKPKPDNAIFFITSPKESSSDDFDENFNLQYNDIAEMGIDLKEFVKRNTEELKTFDNYKKLAERYFYWFGKEIYEIVFTGNVSAIPYPLKWKQWYIVYKQKGYVVTYCTQAEKKDKYDPVATSIFKTIRIK